MTSSLPSSSSISSSTLGSGSPSGDPALLEPLLALEEGRDWKLPALLLRHNTTATAVQAKASITISTTGITVPSIMYSVVLWLVWSTTGNEDNGTAVVVWGQDGDTEGGGGVTVAGGLVILV